MKDKLIIRLNKVAEELVMLEKALQDFLSQIPKDRNAVSKMQTIQGGLSSQQLIFKEFEFTILCNILIEEFQVNINVETSETTKNRYNSVKKQLIDLSKNTTEIPEELKKFLESSGK
jgi:hypothetical protein